LTGAKLFYEAGTCFECFTHCRNEVNLVCLRFGIRDEVYSCYLPAKEVSFEYTATVSSAACRLLETDEKLVLHAVAKFKAKAAEVTAKAA
jgi:hypothetical protein